MELKAPIGWRKRRLPVPPPIPPRNLFAYAASPIPLVCGDCYRRSRFGVPHRPLHDSCAIRLKRLRAAHPVNPYPSPLITGGT